MLNEKKPMLNKIFTRPMTSKKPIKLGLTEKELKNNTKIGPLTVGNYFTKENTKRNNTDTSSGSEKRQIDEEEEKDNFVDNIKLNVKEMVEKASVDQRAISMISDTLELFNNKNQNDNDAHEKYELIDKQEFESLVSNHKKFSKLRVELKLELKKLKDEYIKISNEVLIQNKQFNNKQNAKTESITKLYGIENELNTIIVKNSKLKNEIDKEMQEKNNIFRALNEFKKKYGSSIPQELKDLFKIGDKFSTQTFIPEAKTESLESKLDDLKQELDKKDARIKQLSDKIRDLGITSK